MKSGKNERPTNGIWNFIFDLCDNHKNMTNELKINAMTSQTKPSSTLISIIDNSDDFLHSFINTNRQQKLFICLWVCREFPGSNYSDKTIVELHVHLCACSINSFKWQQNLTWWIVYQALKSSSVCLMESRIFQKLFH